MQKHRSRRPALALRHQLTGSLLAIPAGVAAGSASAFFLWALDRVTQLHWAHPWLLWTLPLTGIAVGWLYHCAGRGSEKGNNLLLDAVHNPCLRVPARMAPFVLLGTLATHLSGGSAGREGTAVQMGGSLADSLARLLRAGPGHQRTLLLCGIAAGFGAVFGTPLAGAVFALEVLVRGRVEWRTLLPVTVASFTGDAVCTAWGAEHTHYALAASFPEVSGFFPGTLLLGKAALAAAGFGLAAWLFCLLSRRLQRAFVWLVPYAPLRPALGAGVVIALVFLTASRDYLGLGVMPPPGGHVSIVRAFEPGGADPLSWFWKTLFTTVTLSSGFKGGEVTPLFFVGATLGNSLAALLHAPVPLFAAFGFIAVFGAAAKTPLACAIMGLEIFGWSWGLHFLLVCWIATRVSGQAGIYQAQRAQRQEKISGH